MENIQRKINYLTYVGCATAPLSIIGSSLILLSIFKTRQYRDGKRLTSYHRLLAGVASLDILFSLGLTLGPMPMPRESGLPGSKGTTATCTTQGLLLQMGYGSFFYSACLMVYYALVVCFNIPDEAIARNYEPLLHFLPLAFSVSTSILGLAWEVFNPQSFRCWVGTYPFGCEYIDPSLCERGAKHAETFGLWLTVYPVIAWTCVTLLCLLFILYAVVGKLRQSRQFQFNNTRVSATSQTSKMRMVITQCLLYGFFYLNCVIWGVTATFIDISDKTLDVLGKHYWMVAFINTFFPLQGFFFFLIYIRPRYLTLRSIFPEDNRWQTICIAIWDPEQAEMNSSRSQSRRTASRSRSRLSNSREDRVSAGAAEEGANAAKLETDGMVERIRGSSSEEEGDKSGTVGTDEVASNNT